MRGIRAGCRTGALGRGGQQLLVAGNRAFQATGLSRWLQWPWLNIPKSTKGGASAMGGTTAATTAAWNWRNSASRCGPASRYGPASSCGPTRCGPASRCGPARRCGLPVGVGLPGRCGLPSLGRPLELLGPHCFSCGDCGWSRCIFGFWLPEPQGCLLKWGHLCPSLQAFLAALAGCWNQGSRPGVLVDSRNCEADPPADVFTVAASWIRTNQNRLLLITLWYWLYVS